MAELYPTLGAIGAFLAAIAAVWHRLKLGKLLNGTSNFLADWNGEPERPGRDRIPSFPERMKVVEDRTSDMNHSFRGEMSSRLILLGEALDKLAQLGETNRTSLDRLEGRVDGIDHRITEHRRRNEEQIDNLRTYMERRLADRDGDRARADAYRAALHELGMDVDPPAPPQHPPPDLP